jgi:hypothetical protein
LHENAIIAKKLAISAILAAILPNAWQALTRQASVAQILADLPKCESIGVKRKHTVEVGIARVGSAIGLDVSMCELLAASILKTSRPTRR